MNRFIENYKDLAITEERKKLLQLIEIGLREIKPEGLLKKALKIRKGKLYIQNKAFDLSLFKKIIVLGIGKGSTLASTALAEILGKRLTGGIALDTVQYQEVRPPKIKDNVRRSNFPKLEFLVGTHPLTSRKNVKATQKIIRLIKNLKKDNLLITFICGGGSALLCGSQKEFKNSILATKSLTQSGASILELNTVRKHFSLVKGGGLAKIAYPATVINLIFSDVPGNDISMVASGPTVFDKTTKKDARKILQKYNLSTSDVDRLRETPKDKKYFEKVYNFLVSSNKNVLEELKNKAEALGFKARIYKDNLEGEAQKVGKILLSKVRKRELILAGGETTVKLKGKPFEKPQGKGGRNQELVLGALKYLKEGEMIISIASDGWDNTEAAGAIGDQETLKKAKKLNLDIGDYLNNHDSFRFFKKTGDLIFTGHTGINVSDLMLVYRK